MQKKRKRCKIFEKSATFLLFFLLSLLGSFDGNLAEFLEVLHQGQGGLAGAGTGGLVTFVHLKGCILTEGLGLCVNLFQKLFHGFVN